MDDLKRFVEQDAFARHLGIELLECALIAHFRGTVYRKSTAIGDVFAP